MYTAGKILVIIFLFTPAFYGVGCTARGMRNQEWAVAATAVALLLLNLSRVVVPLTAAAAFAQVAPVRQSQRGRRVERHETRRRDRDVGTRVERRRKTGPGRGDES